MKEKFFRTTKTMYFRSAENYEPYIKVSVGTVLLTKRESGSYEYELFERVSDGKQLVPFDSTKRYIKKLTPLEAIAMQAE